MADWPTRTEFGKWVSSQQMSPVKQADQIPYAFDAALEVVKDDACIELFSAYDADADPAQTMETIGTVPERLRLAVFILASRLLSRSDSPTGVIGFAEFAVRVGSEDPDYQRLITRYHVPGVA